MSAVWFCSKIRLSKGFLAFLKFIILKKYLFRLVDVHLNGFVVRNGTVSYANGSESCATMLGGAPVAGNISCSGWLRGTG